MRGTRHVGMLLAAVVGATLTGCGGAGEARPAPEPPAADATASDPTTLVVGRVTVDGEPVAGAEVSAELWPADTEDIAEGGTVDTHEVTGAVTDEDGAWSLQQDVREVPPRYLRGDDSVDVELVVRVDGELAGWNVPVTRTGGTAERAAWRSWAEDTLADPPHRIDMDFGTLAVRDVRSDGEVTEGELTVFPDRG